MCMKKMVPLNYPQERPTTQGLISTWRSFRILGGSLFALMMDWTHLHHSTSQLFHTLYVFFFSTFILFIIQHYLLHLPHY